MSITTKLDAFSLKVRKKGNKEKYLRLDDIAGYKLLEELSAYLKKNIYLFKIDKKNERTYRIEKNEHIDNSLYCRIKVGKFGETSELVDTVSGSGVFQKEREHSDTVPLFFHIKEDKSGESATLHVQRNINRTLLPELRGILTTVLESLREDLFIFEIKPLKKSIELKNFINKESGEISSVDISLNTSLNDDLEPLNITIKSKPRKSFPKDMVENLLKASQTGSLKALEPLLPNQIRELGVKKASITVRSPKSGKIRVAVGDKIHLTNSYTIPVGTGNLDKTGHMKYSYLKEISDKYMD